MSYLNTDIPDLRGYDTGTVLQNLAEITLRQNLMTESKIAHPEELISSIIQDGDDIDTVTSILLSLQGSHTEDDLVSKGKVSSDVYAQSLDQIEDLTRNMDLYERLYIYRGIIKRFINSTDNTSKYIFACTDKLTDQAANRIAYMQSNIASKAYIRLSELVPNCRAAEFDSFEDVCADVYNGHCKYCILPIETTGMGRLQTFLRLIEKYGLKISAVCDIPDSSGSRDATTRLALLQRNLVFLGADASLESGLRISDLPFGTGYMLEILHRTDNNNTLSFTKLLLAAQFCNISLIRTETSRYVSQTTAIRDLHLSTVFDISNADLLTFLWYLSLEAPDDDIVGIYRSL